MIWICIVLITLFEVSSISVEGYAVRPKLTDVKGSPNNDYMHCLADCLDLSVTKIAQLIDRCHDDVHCWAEALGPKAAACLVECALKKKQLEVSQVEDSPNNNYVKCLANCLHLSLTKIAELIEKCHKDQKCWVKALGPQAASCLVKCALGERRTKINKVEKSSNNDYMHCLADCLDLSVTKIAQLIDKCHDDVHCWAEALGPKAAACLVECALKKQQLEVSQVEDSPNNNYVKCLANCLHLSLTKIAELIEKCHKDQKCWVKALGPQAASCLVKCALGERHTKINKVEKSSNNDYMHCLADCLDLSVTKIAQLIDKCHDDVHCWAEALGPKAAACLVECALKKQQLEVSQVEDSPNNNYVKCLANCLHLSLTKIAELIEKCHKDQKCWVKALGPQAASCLVKCALGERRTKINKVERSPNNDYMHCLADCLDLSVMKIAQLIDRCHGDVHCWEEALGPKAAACLVECALKKQQEVAKVEDPLNKKYIKCLADCLHLTATKIAGLIDKCHKSAKCWVNALGPKAASCLVKCAFEETQPVLRNIQGFHSPSNDYMHCLADCLDLSVSKIAQLIDKCHDDVHCWVEALGPKAAACLVECALNKKQPQTTVEVSETVSWNALKRGENENPAVNFPFFCMGKCMLTTLAQIRQWYAECHHNWRCWLEKAGPKVIECLAECFLEQAHIPDAHGLVEHVIKTARVTSSKLQHSNDQRLPFKMSQHRYQIV